jgi:hypothetical protein
VYDGTHCSTAHMLHRRSRHDAPIEAGGIMTRGSPPAAVGIENWAAPIQASGLSMD